jgi:hypothetical protein
LLKQNSGERDQGRGIGSFFLYSLEVRRRRDSESECILRVEQFTQPMLDDLFSVGLPALDGFSESTELFLQPTEL